MQNKKCDSFGCNNRGERSYSVGVATQLFLCQKCINEFEKDKGAEKLNDERHKTDVG